jgi:hypothetical protein
MKPAIKVAVIIISLALAFAVTKYYLISLRSGFARQQNTTDLLQR